MDLRDYLGLRGRVAYVKSNLLTEALDDRGPHPLGGGR